MSHDLGAATRFSLFLPPFLPIYDLSSSFSLRSLSSIFREVMTTSDECTGTLAVPPFCFSLVTPSTLSLPSAGMTLVTFPSMFLNSPRTILTESPFRGVRERRLYFSRSSFERPEPNFISISSNYDRGQVGYAGPLLSRLARHRSLDVGPLQVPFRSHYHRSVVLEGDPLAAQPPHRVLLPDYDGAEDLLSEVRGTPLDDADHAVAYRGGGVSAEPRLCLGDHDDPQGLRACVVGAGDDRVERDRPGDVILELLYSLGGDRTRLR